MVWYDKASDIECSICRRKILRGVGGATAATLTSALAGCAGEEEDGLVNDPDDDPEDYPEWDPQDPEFPQLMSTLIPEDMIPEAGYHRPTREYLEQLPQRDEPAYGNTPREMPAPEDEWIDPDTLIFARGPTEATPEEYRDQYAPFMERIREETGKDVEFFDMQNFAAGVEAMRGERLHIAAFDTGTTPFAVNLAGAGERMYLSISTGGLVGYYLWLATYVGSGINSVEDLAGHTIAHGSETSNSGNLAPRAIFKNDFGVEPGEDYEVEFSGGHEQTIRGIHSGDYIAGPVCSSCVMRVYDGDDQLHPDDGPGGQPIKVVFQQTFPSGVQIIRYNLHPDILEALDRVYMETDWASMDMEWEAEDFVKVDYASYFHPVLLVQKEQEIDYGEDLGG